MTAPTTRARLLQVQAPLEIWALTLGALFHAARARQADDAAVQVLETFGARLTLLLEQGGMDPTQIDEAIGLLAICEHCGCAPHRACEGGCAWSGPHLAAERFVCTRCMDKVPAPGEDPRGPVGGLILPGDARFGIPR